VGVGEGPIEAEIPAGKVLHVILDNYGAHKHAKVRAWLNRHPRFVFHYTPTSASWLNAVEGFFAKLAKRRIKRGIFRSVADLLAAINRFRKETNDNPKPFVWKADPDKHRRRQARHQALESIHQAQLSGTSARAISRESFKPAKSALQDERAGWFLRTSAFGIAGGPENAAHGFRFLPLTHWQGADVRWTEGSDGTGTGDQASDIVH
jgi:transposase